MVGCGRCDDWFHGDCIGLDLAKVQQMEKDDQEFVCLKCCADEGGKGNTENTDNNSASDQKQGPEASVTAGGIRPFKKVRLLDQIQSFLWFLHSNAVSDFDKNYLLLLFRLTLLQYMFSRLSGGM